MPFTLPDLRPNAPKPILNGHALPVVRPDLTPAQLAARQRAEDAWFKPLTHKQRKFIGALYANGFDIQLAAQEADPSLTPTVARSVGGKWMKMPSIQNAIEAIHAHYMEGTKVRFDDMVNEIKAIAFSDISAFFDSDNALPPPGDPRYKSVQEISITPTRWGPSTRVKQYDKLAAMEKLLKIYSPTAEAQVPTLSGGNTTVNVQTVNIMPVPQGMYLPAAQAVPAKLIDHAPQPRRALQNVEATVLEVEQQ